MDNQVDKNAINPNEVNYDANNKTNKFNLIIGIATLLIAILGATFAYFSATATSAENDVTVKSAYVSISYDGGTEIKASNLIPSTLNVAMSKYQKTMEPFVPTEEQPDYITDYDTFNNDKDRRCVDANGKEVCYVYQFSVESDGAVPGETNILASIKINKNEFENLSYTLYRVEFKKDENGEIQKDKFGFGIVDFENEKTGPVEVAFVPDPKKRYEGTQYADYKFEYFEESPFDGLDENGGVISRYPVACLFGYAEDADTKELDNTSRCATYPLNNKEKYTFQLIIWLDETTKVQDEQGMIMEGTVSIEVPDGLGVGEYSDGVITGRE